MPEGRDIPALTVVIPAFQMERWIDKAITSVLGQHQALEIVVVDDASSDATGARALQALHDVPGALVVQNRRPKGVSGARNTGLSHASAPWVLFLDADDELRPGAVERLLAARRPGDVAVLGCFGAIDEEGEDKVDSWADEISTWVAEHGSPSVIGLRELSRANIMPPPGAQIMATGPLRAVGGFDEISIPRGGSEDFEVLARLSWQGAVRLIDDRVLSYRRREGSQSSRSDHNVRRARSRLLSVRRSPRWKRPSIGIALAARYGRLGSQRLSDGVRSGGVRTIARAGVNFGLAALCAAAGVGAVVLPHWSPTWRLDDTK